MPIFPSKQIIRYLYEFILICWQLDQSRAQHTLVHKSANLDTTGVHCRTPIGYTGGSAAYVSGLDRPELSSLRFTQLDWSRITPSIQCVSPSMQLQFSISVCLGLSIGYTEQTNRPCGAYCWPRLPCRPNCRGQRQPIGKRAVVAISKTMTHQLGNANDYTRKTLWSKI